MNQEAVESDVFNDHRSLLFAIAYRMIGSVMDAEDIVQEAYLRWQRRGESVAQSPKAYLSTVVTRLCVDHLRAAHTRRETYTGTWLPEPLVTEGEPDIADVAALHESLSLEFLVLLETLTPVERAVFLLHDVFAYDFHEVAGIVGKSEANCRQLGRRARQQIQSGRPRFDPSSEHQEHLTRHFITACAATLPASSRPSRATRRSGRMEAARRAPRFDRLMGRSASRHSSSASCGKRRKPPRSVTLR